MEPIEQLTHIVPTLNGLVDRIEPDQLDNSTPCEEFAVRDVLDHMVTLGGSFAYAFRGEPVPEIDSPDTDGRVPTTEFHDTMDDLLASVMSPGAMERTVASPVGEMPGETFARLVAFDGLIHGWDLSVATGQPYVPPAAVVEAVDAFARAALTDEIRSTGMFKPATEAPWDSSRLEQLVAFSGRTL
jgi:uncharacterized protein (TIGR03086 family)